MTWKYISATQITERSLQWPVQKQGSMKCTYFSGMQSDKQLGCTLDFLLVHSSRIVSEIPPPFRLFILEDRKSLVY